jgi:rubrerythrin
MYSLKEILDLAVQMEQAGYDFYTASGEKFAGEIYHETFTFLAEQEKSHKRKFEEMLKHINDIKSEHNEDYYRYMKSLGGDRIFKRTDLKETFKFVNTPQDALLKGMDDEKNSIFFYNEIKRAYSKDSKETDVLDEIIAEERSHIMKLALIHSKLTAL